MATVVDLAEYRARRQPVGPPPVPKELTKEDIAIGVAAAYRKLLGPVEGVGLNAKIRLIGAAAARAIVKEVKGASKSIGAHARFQFFGVKQGDEFCLVGRINCVSLDDELGFCAENYLIDADSLRAFYLSATSNIAKNNTFTVLITLPMSDFYNL